MASGVLSVNQNNYYIFALEIYTPAVHPAIFNEEKHYYMPIKAKEDDIEDVQDKKKDKASSLFDYNEEMKEPVSAE
jgi:hypothetical protein